MRGAALVLAMLAAPAAFAEGIYLTLPQLEAKLFPKATHAQVSTLTLTAAEADRASHLYGYRLAETRFKTIALFGASGPLGTIFIVNVVGQNEPITFGVGVTPQGIIRGVQVVAYREPRGDEIRNPRFLRQLTGKSLASPLKLGVDVDAITGATISSRSATFAARKALSLAAVLRARKAEKKPPAPKPGAVGAHPHPSHPAAANTPLTHGPARP